MLEKLGLTTMRRHMIGWAISAVLVLAGVLLLVTGSTGLGLIIFVLGAIGSVVVTLGILRLRSGIDSKRRSGS